MPGTSADVIVNGTKAKIVHAEGGGYRKSYVRRHLQQQLISQGRRPALASREDYVRLMQDDWSGGATWWKPILSEDTINTYFRGNHMDAWSEPGKVVPTNQVADAANASIADDCVLVATEDAVYAIGQTSNVNASFRDVYKWTPASNAFVQETGYHSGVGAGDQPVSAVYDYSDGFVYILAQRSGGAGREVDRFNPSTASINSDWYTNVSLLEYGSSIVVTRQGILFYGGGSVFLLDKSGPSASSIFSDGKVEALSLPGASSLFRTEEMMVATPEGVFYAKNTLTGGQYQPWVYRLDRDAAGNWIGEPLAPLPIGSVALSISYHLGSVVVAASPEPQTIIDQTEHAEVILYNYVDKQPGALGAPLGRGEVDETPYGMLGSSGPLLYVGGHKRLWVYDAVRGGLHSAWEWGTATTLGPYRTMAWVRDSDDDGALIFLGPDRIARTKRGLEDDPDTVTNFGDDETHYTLESNYFDFNLPFELKELAKVEIQHDAIDASGNQEWTVQIAADDGSFTDVLTSSTASSTYASATLNGTTGRRFRYKLIYQTKDADRIPLRGLLISAVGGENVTRWTLLLDGDELLNMDNEVQDEQDFYDSMNTIAGTETQITLVDNMQEQAQETSTATTVQVNVIEADIIKEKAGESLIRLVLQEA